MVSTNMKIKGKRRPKNKLQIKNGMEKKGKTGNSLMKGINR